MSQPITSKKPAAQAIAIARQAVKSDVRGSGLPTVWRRSVDALLGNFECRWDSVRIFCLLGEIAPLGKTNTTQALAKATGGTTFPFTCLKGLEQAIQVLLLIMRREEDDLDDDAPLFRL